MRSDQIVEIVAVCYLNRVSLHDDGYGSKCNLPALTYVLAERLALCLVSLADNLTKEK